MIELVIDNVKTRIVGKMSTNHELNESYHSALRKALGYEMMGAGWSDKYKENKWDGIISLYNKTTQSFPTGLVSQAVEVLELFKIPFKYVNKRKVPERNYNVTTNFKELGRDLRFYQEEAAKRAIEKTRGIISLATAAGKTMTICEIIARMKVSPVVVYVPTITLLKQTQKEFAKFLSVDGKPAHIGMAGGGICDLNMTGINVMTWQTALNAFNDVYSAAKDKVIHDDKTENHEKLTLQQTKQKYIAAKKTLQEKEKFATKEVEAMRPNGKRKEVSEKQKADYFRKLTSAERREFGKAETLYRNTKEPIQKKEDIRNLVISANAIIYDEAHVAAIVIQTLSEYAINAYYRFGLSATPFREDNQEIRIDGALGKIFIEVSATNLVDLGYTVPLRIFMVKDDYVVNAETYADIYTENVVENWNTNYRIKLFAEAFKDAGMPVLIIVDEIQHGQNLQDMIRDSVFVSGSDKGEDDPTDEEQDYRRRMLNAAERNEIILIATKWANTGVDAQRLQVLILGGSTQSTISTLQSCGRVNRCIGKNYEESVRNGKSFAIVIDFMRTEKHLHSHSVRRKKVYKLEPAWSIKTIV